MPDTKIVTEEITLTTARALKLEDVITFYDKLAPAGTYDAVISVTTAYFSGGVRSV